MGSHADRTYYDVRELEKYIAGRNTGADSGAEAEAEPVKGMKDTTTTLRKETGRT
jgi:hypothetical protein